MSKKHEVKFPKLEFEMLKRGITQKALATLLGQSQPTIGRKLSGVNEWTIGDVEILCNYFNMDYYQLFK